MAVGDGSSLQEAPPRAAPAESTDTSLLTDRTCTQEPLPTGWLQTAAEGFGKSEIQHGKMLTPPSPASSGLQTSHIQN